MKNEIEIYEEERPWGSFRRFTNNMVSTVKILTVKPNEQLSVQTHKKRKEFWRVIKGSGIFEVNEIKNEAKIGFEINISIGDKHTIKGGNEGIEVLEIALGEFDENDIVRYQDKYGRA